MGFRINTNVAALTAHNNAVMNNNQINSSLAKLSSGLRINTAADDASGLTIADSLRSQASSLGQGIANGNDAIGLLQTADGALSEYGNILDTIKTKAVQAASDGQNSTSRQAIQKDIDSLMKELNTIAKTTSFNGQQLLSGSFTNKEFQMGANANQSAKVSIASAETNKVGLTTRTTLDLASKTGGDVALNLTSATTGQNIQLQKVSIQMNNNPANGMGALADAVNQVSGETGITAKAVVGSQTGIIQAGTTGSDFAINGVNIGSVITKSGDSSGALISAINTQTSQTGVSAAMNTDGSMKLTSTDGRAIQVTGDTASVLGKTAGDLSTVGHLDLVQSGAANFQVSNVSAGAVGLTLTTSAGVTTNADSTIAAGSTLKATSVLAVGSVVGGNATIGGTTLTQDALVAKGSSVASGSILKEGTTIGGDFVVTTSLVANENMLVKAGSTLGSGSILKAGTVVTTAYTDAASDVHNVGETLTIDSTTAGALVLSQDMTVTKNSTINSAAGSLATLKAGSFLGNDLTSVTKVVTTQDMTLKSGSTLGATSILTAGSVTGAATTLTGADMTVTSDMLLKASSTIAAASTLAAGSTLGAATTTNTGATVLTTDMSIKSGSTLQSGSILKAGTTVTQDLVAATFNSGTTYQAGDVLKKDETIKAGQSIVTTADMTMTAGSTLGDGSSLKANDGKSGTLAMGTTTNSSLSNIDVTTLDGAMKAIDTVSAAITSLDSIRANIGSAQNQVTSTINNISTTQVNLAAAESSIRDVDFASESANFSKHNILAQSGSYAMSQANAVQQNVLRLLQ